MARILNLNTLHAATRAESNGLQLSNDTHCQNVNQQWTSLQRKLNCNGRFSCLFSDNRREVVPFIGLFWALCLPPPPSPNHPMEQARKALESALGGKKNEFEKWNKEIEKREEAGGGDAGGGGWFGQGGRFGWSDGDHFWQEAQQTCLAVLGIVIMYLIVAKGELMLAVVFNPLLYCLRGIRNGFSVITSIIQRKSSLDIPAHLADMSRKEVYSGVSAKERVVRKWGNE